MDLLTGARREIDEIDGEMARLFEKRMNAVRAVAEHKRQNGIPVLDEAREEQVVQKNLLRLENKELSRFYEGFIRNNMAVSRAFQKSLLCKNTVGYQGVEGAYSHIALKRLFPLAQEKAFSTWDEVFISVEAGEIENGVLPIENSFAGDVSEVLDLCFKHECYIQAVYDLPIEHSLLCANDAEIADIKTVYSHTQAISQCAKFLKSLSLTTQTCANTAMAAQLVAESKRTDIAAIASPETAEIYGLKTLASNINTSETNTTRFIVIGKSLLNRGNRLSLLFTVPHTAGSLARAIAAIGESGFNMESIKSRPIPQRPWEYYFYTEIIAPYGETKTDVLLAALKAVCQSVRILGAYYKDKTE